MSAWPERAPRPAAADVREFENALKEALGRHRRSISPKYFYDARGSALFDQICALPEYYPTRTEMALLQRHAGDMADLVGPRAEIVEFGAGSLRKIRLLLPALQEPVRFLPADISAAHLQREAGRLREEYPGLVVEPLAMDHSEAFALPPRHPLALRRVGFFPGSSLGNFTPPQARRFLRQCARALAGGGLLIGIDMVKSPERLHLAYNDSAGVTAAFNKNLLVRANAELGANFDVESFDHYAFYNPWRQRVEMHLVSRRAQRVRVGDEVFAFRPGQTLHTESSYKYTVEGFQAMARDAGWSPARVWKDDAGLFSLHWLSAPAQGVVSTE